MKARSQKQDSLVIVYDADRIPQPGPELFDPACWRDRGAVAGQAAGRGHALLLQTAFGPAVLRQYLRGGWPARFSRACYLFLGYARSRPLAEFDLLAELAQAGLPVPPPLAALCARRGLCYRGWLLMERIPDVTPLADVLGARAEDAALWRRCGATIRRFHAAGVVHADLNARNLLVGPDHAIHLVDFDRARVREGDLAGFHRNLARLKRSLDKLWPAATRNRLEPCWQWLLEGYAAEGGAP
ncbi:MAG: 3-deoxy-D-manno-octulosonic acid kinase [Xanthomonadales bacterium]|nr:3-deoxy-D-manno-octulosonic acid kinase [Xanthomonadales bacterium]